MKSLIVIWVKQLGLNQEEMNDQEFDALVEDYFLREMAKVDEKNGIEEEELKERLWKAIIKDYPRLNNPFWRMKFGGLQEGEKLEFTNEEFEAAVEQCKQRGFFEEEMINGEISYKVNMEAIKAEIERLKNE